MLQDVRFWIFALAALMILLLLINNLINISFLPQATRSVYYVAWTIRFVCIILVCHFFITKSSSLILLDDQTSLKRLLFWTSLVAMILFCGLTVFFFTESYLDYDNVISNIDVMSCQSIAPLLFDLLGFLTFVMMTFMGHKIKLAMERAKKA